MHKPLNKRSRWTISRWLFIGLTIVSLVILVMAVRTFLFNAQMSLGVIGTLTGRSLKGMVVNQQPYTSPDNGVLRFNQLHVLLRVAEDLDWQAINNKSKESKRYAFAKILNRHVMSIQEYQWVRTTTVRTLELKGKYNNRVDSLNIDRLRMFDSRFRTHYKVFTENLDSEAF